MNTPASSASVILAIITVCYLLRIWLVPFKTCRRCKGMGRTARPSGRGRPKPCRRCKETGLRPRLIRITARSAKRIVDQAEIGRGQAERGSRAGWLR